MEYMEDLMGEAERQFMILHQVSAMYCLWVYFDTYSIDYKRSVIPIQEYLRNVLTNKINIISIADIRKVISELVTQHPENEFLYSSGIAASIAENNLEGITFDDLFGWIGSCFRKRLVIPAEKILIVMIKKYPERNTNKDVNQVVNALMKKNVFPADVIISAVKSNVQDMTLQDVETWINLFTPDPAAGRTEARWEQYQQVAMSVIKKRQVEVKDPETPNETRTLIGQGIPGIEPEEELNAIRGWIATLESAGETLLAVELKVEVFARESTAERKAAHGLTALQIKEDIDRCFERLGGGMVKMNYIRSETERTIAPKSLSRAERTIALALRAMDILGVKVKPSDDEHVIGLEDILRWDSKSSFESSDLLCAAINNKDTAKYILPHQLFNFVDHAVKMAKQTVQEKFYEQASAIAAAAVRAGLIDRKTALEWLVSTPGVEPIPLSASAPLAVAVTEHRKELKVSDEELSAIVEKYSATNHTGQLAEVGSALLQEGVTVQPDTVITWVTRCLEFSDDDATLMAGVRFAAVVMSVGAAGWHANYQARVWCEGLVASGRYLEAVDLAVAARDASLDVPDYLIRDWEAKLLTGKTPIEEANNAVKLIAIHRARRAYQRTAGIQEQIDQAFQKVKARGSEMGLTANMPIKETMAKIEEILFETQVE